MLYRPTPKALPRREFETLRSTPEDLSTKPPALPQKTPETAREPTPGTRQDRAHLSL